MYTIINSCGDCVDGRADSVEVQLKNNKRYETMEAAEAVLASDIAELRAEYSRLYCALTNDPTLAKQEEHVRQLLVKAVHSKVVGLIEAK